MQMKEGVSAVAFDPSSSGKIFSCGAQVSDAICWDVASGKQLKRHPVGSQGSTCLLISQDGRLMACDELCFSIHSRRCRG